MSAMRLNAALTRVDVKNLTAFTHFKVYGALHQLFAHTDHHLAGLLELPGLDDDF